MKAPDPVADEGEGLQSVTREALDTLRHLQAAIAVQIEAGTATAALQREASSLARSITALGAEMRQQEKFYEARALALDDDQVEALITEWLIETSSARRKRVRAAMDEAEGKSTLLG